MSSQGPSEKLKGLMVILDGVGDRACSLLDGATPLEAAHKPHLDRLAADGICGLVDPLYPGMPVGTHTGTGVLMGLAVRDAYELPRGPVEAAGVGVQMQPGDIALRCNFATLRADGAGFEILDRRAGRIREGTHELASVLRNVELSGGVVAHVHPATHHRAVLRLTGRALSAGVTDTDPGAGGQPMRVLNSRPRRPDNLAAADTAAAINELIHEAYARLDAHPVNRGRQTRGELPANGIITRGAGKLRELTNLLRREGLKVAVVAAEQTVLGLGRLFDYTVVTEEAFTSLPDTDLQAKVEATRSALADHDLVILHIKGTDICAHDRDPLAKKAFIERVDAALQTLLTPELVIAVTGDHSTDSNTGCHCGDPVPSVLYSPRGRRDGCRLLSESACTPGGLGRIAATSFLLSMLDYMGHLHNYRPTDRHYFLSDPARPRRTTDIP